MSGEEFYLLFTTRPYVRKVLCQYVCRFARCFAAREDMLQEAWIAIAELNFGENDEYYLSRGYKAIEACYKREYRYRKNVEKLTRRYEYDATYRRKKYFLKVARKTAVSVH